MKHLKKDYYALPEAAERSGIPIDDILCLAERREIMLSVEAHHWPIVWGDERALPGEELIGSMDPIKPPSVEAHRWPIGCDKKRTYPGEAQIGSKEPIKPPFDYYNSGHFNLLWYDIRDLRKDGKLSLTDVYAKKDNREFIGSIQRGTTDFHGQQHECELELRNIFISHEELQRIEKHEVGDWYTKKDLAPTGNTTDGRSAPNTKKQNRDERLQQECIKLKKEHPDKPYTWISERIAKLPIAKGIKSETIRRIMRQK